MTQFVKRCDLGMHTCLLPERIAVEAKRPRGETRPWNALSDQVLLEPGGDEAATVVDTVVGVDGSNELVLDAAPVTRKSAKQVPA